MELSTLIGMVVVFVFLVIGIFWGGGNLMQFFDPSSIMITFGGSVCGMLASFSFSELGNMFVIMGIAFKKSHYDVIAGIKTIIDLANTARKEGLLALEEHVKNVDDPFLQKGVQLIVDGNDAELVKNIMEAEIVSLDSRHQKGAEMLDVLAEMGPAFGMLGTLIGLVIMLYNMTDAETLGKGMAAALITTFYGSMLANALAKPLSYKLKRYNASEVMFKEILLEGMLSIQAGENPRIIEEKLYSFLPRVTREQAAEQSQNKTRAEE